MTLEEEIEAIYKLDAERTQGDTKIICSTSICHEIVEHFYSLAIGDTKLFESIDSEDKLPNIYKDIYFIAAAPQMVSIIRRLEAKIKELEAWYPVETAPKCEPKIIHTVLVTRIPANGRPPVMAAHLTSHGWCVKGYGLGDWQPNGHRYRPLHFKPTHWRPLPRPKNED